MRSLQEIYEDTENTNDLTLFCLFASCEPINFEEAVQHKRWKAAIDEGIKAIEKNATWKLTILSKGHKAIGVKWVYKDKRNAKGEVERYKVRLMAKGYKQRASIDHDEIFTPRWRLLD